MGNHQTRELVDELSMPDHVKVCPSEGIFFRIDFVFVLETFLDLAVCAISWLDVSWKVFDSTQKGSVNDGYS
jgi:hypothetical protein